MSAHDPNSNRPGYKETKVGWIPEEWDETRLGDLTADGKPIVYGIVQAGPDTPGGIPYIRSTDVGGRMVPESGLMRTTKEIAKKYRRAAVESGDIVFSLRGNIGSCSIIPVALNGANLTQGTARISLSKRSDSQFVRYALGGFDVCRLIDTWAKGSTFREITIDDLRKVPIPYAPLPEQKKIAEILSTCDEVIEKTGALIEAKKRQKRALMQQLLTGRKRLPGFAGEWEEVQLSDICERVTKTAEKPDGYPVLSITAGRGFVSQADKFSRLIAGKQVEKYVLLKCGEFAYNKGNSYRYPQGCVYRLSEYDEGLVPNVFYSFRLIESSADPEFIRQYFLAGLHNKDLYRWINSGVRNNGLLNLNASDFFKLPINLPPIDEQERVGEVLRYGDDELATLERKLAALKQQKRALMQKLLTGQVRVKLP